MVGWSRWTEKQKNYPTNRLLHFLFSQSFLSLEKWCVLIRKFAAIGALWAVGLVVVALESAICCLAG